jgi:hypothetical protein
MTSQEERFSAVIRTGFRTHQAVDFIGRLRRRAATA